jgi:hypothetical protein
LNLLSPPEPLIPARNPEYTSRYCVLHIASFQLEQVLSRIHSRFGAESMIVFQPETYSHSGLDYRRTLQVLATSVGKGKTFSLIHSIGLVHHKNVSNVSMAKGGCFHKVQASASQVCELCNAFAIAPLRGLASCYCWFASTTKPNFIRSDTDRSLYDDDVFEKPGRGDVNPKAKFIG